MKKLWLGITIIAIVTLVSGGCAPSRGVSSPSPSAPPGGTPPLSPSTPPGGAPRPSPGAPTVPALGTLAVYATDALPKEVTAVVIKAKDIEAHIVTERPSSGQPTPTPTQEREQEKSKEKGAPKGDQTREQSRLKEKAAETPESEQGKWITVIQNPPSFDLVKISGVGMLLGTSQVEAGKYTQVRISVIEVIATIDGKEVKAEVPSDKLKLVGNFTVEKGKETAITLDFDAEKSVVLRGKQEPLFKPVIKLIVGKPEKTQTPPPSSPKA